MNRLFINNQNTLDYNNDFAFIVESLDKSLSPDWEIYTEPWLNGSDPDIVLSMKTEEYILLIQDFNPMIRFLELLQIIIMQ